MPEKVIAETLAERRACNLTARHESASHKLQGRNTTSRQLLHFHPKANAISYAHAETEQTASNSTCPGLRETYITVVHPQHTCITHKTHLLSALVIPTSYERIT